ncbi:MAG: T9SS type A sorting domain-containing protein [Bacteroidales bacterium]|nr:T9SS type A sorting domain-containing protein [Bacteroidales bacterium]
MKYIPWNEERRNGAVTMTPTVMLLNHEAYGNPPTVSFVDSTNVFGLMKECRFEYRAVDGSTLAAPSYEFYFDTPHQFTLPADTFYVTFYWPDERAIRYLYWWEYDVSRDYDKWMRYLGGIQQVQGSLRIEWWDANHMFDFDSSRYLEGTTTVGWGYLFPIINLRCTAPNMRRVGYEGGTATVSWWQAEAGMEYQLSLGRYGSDPDSGMLITTADTFYTFSDLQTDSIYNAWVRKACRYTTAGYDTVVWSDWSRPATFRVGVGIDEVGAGTAIVLQPNPAQDEIRVESSFSLKTIEIWTLDGVLVYHGGAVGHETTVDVSYLRAGTYIVAIHTYNGTTHKKLLITR